MTLYDAVRSVMDEKTYYAEAFNTFHSRFRDAADNADDALSDMQSKYLDYIGNRGKHIAHMWTENDVIDVELTDAKSLALAMEFKATNINAKADPDIFIAVATMLHDVADSNRYNRKEQCDE